ncbi:histone H1A, sperm-like [Lineus longissimus]|uniref:histone H1A, sperm-like n=1 Tax=Lineus longissimus TaxID=88925 RepID=UPI00315DE328
MSDAVAAPASPKKTKAAAKPKVKKTKVAATHPPIAAMVNEAIKNLKDRKGSSLAAIKKYINANYKCDAAKLAPFIRKYLKKAVVDGTLIQTKGVGAAGSFKLKGKDAEDKPKAAKKAAPKAKKPAAEKKPKKAKAKAPVKAKKPKAAKAKTPKKAKPAKPIKKAKKSPAKAKKTKKPAAKKAAKK